MGNVCKDLSPGAPHFEEEELWPCSRSHPGCVSRGDEKPLTSLSPTASFSSCPPTLTTRPPNEPVRGRKVNKTKTWWTRRKDPGCRRASPKASWESACITLLTVTERRLTFEVLEHYLMPPALSQSPCGIREAGVLGLSFRTTPPPSRFNFAVSVTIRSCVNSQRKFPLSLSTCVTGTQGIYKGQLPPSLPHPTVFYSGLAGFTFLPAWQRVVLKLRIHNTTASPWDHVGGGLGGLFLRMGEKINALQPGGGRVTLKPAAAYH